jgi:hypothetical protein
MVAGRRSSPSQKSSAVRTSELDSAVFSLVGSASKDDAPLRLAQMCRLSRCHLPSSVGVPSIPPTSEAGVKRASRPANACSSSCLPQAF